MYMYISVHMLTCSGWAVHARALCAWQVLWEVYSYEFAGAAGLPAAAADLLMLSMLSDAHRSISNKGRPGTTTAVYQFNGSVGLCPRISRVSCYIGHSALFLCIK